MIRQINLLPDSIQKAARLKTVKLSVSATIIPTVILLVVVHLFLSWKSAEVAREAALPPSVIETAEMGQLRQQIGELQMQIKEYYQSDKALMDISMRRFTAPNILKILGKAIQQKAWLRKINFDSQNRTCQLEGRSYSTRLVSEFMLELKKIPYFRTVELISMEKGKEEKVDFKIICQLK